MADGARLRLDLLIGGARIAGALIAAFCLPVLCVRATWLVLQRVAFATAAAHLAAGATILLALSFATLVRHPIERLRSRSTWSAAGAVVAASLVAFLILAAGAGATSGGLFAPFALATFAAALAEEAVFRRYLPDRLADSLGRAGARPTLIAVAIVVIPQLSFALAHAENSAFVGASASELGSLFVAGVLYQGVARVGGLWVAAGVHGALNLTIALGAIHYEAVG
jgi:membrane protease YdiL (CAAX protease family)